MATKEIQKLNGQAKRETFIPQANVLEGEKDLVITLDIPGADDKSVDISLEKNELAISAKVDDEKPEGMDLSYAEYKVGDYKRVFTITEGIDRDNISASVKNGVLKIKLAKKLPETKKINVRQE